MNSTLQAIFDKHQDTPLKRTRKKAVWISVIYAVLLAGFAFAGEYLTGTAATGLPSFIAYIIFGAVAAATIIVFKKRTAILAGITEEENASPTLANTDARTMEIDFCSRLRAAHMFSYRFALAIGALGLIMYYFWADRTILYVMISAGFFLMVIFYPRFEDWQSRLREFRQEDVDLASVLRKQSIGRR